MARIAAAVVAVAALAASPAESFLAGLQRAIAVHDQRAVTAMVQYPIVVLINGVRVSVQDAATMLGLYDSVFTPELEAAIARSRFAAAGRAASTDTVAMTADGLSIASGLVWAQPAGSGFAITRLVVPPPTPARPSVTARAPGPARVPPGQSLTKFSGLLVRRDDARSYVVTARRGQVLQAEISGFRGRDAVLRVFDARTGRPADPPVREGARMWKAPVPASGDYRIDVVRTAPDGGSGLLYLLVVTLL